MTLWRSDIMRALIADRLAVKSIEAQGMAGNWTSFHDEMKDVAEESLVDGRPGGD